MIRRYRGNEGKMADQDPSLLTPVEFEEFVRGVLDQEGMALDGYRSTHLESIHARDGSYVFDVTARFGALGVDFLVVVECKRQSAPIEREQVQALEQKRQSVRAEKAMLFSTAQYRRGALEFANDHRIALALIRHGGTLFHTRSHRHHNPPWSPPFAAWLVQAGETGSTNSALGSFESPFGRHESRGYLLAFLRGDD